MWLNGELDIWPYVYATDSADRIPERRMDHCNPCSIIRNAKHLVQIFTIRFRGNARTLLTAMIPRLPPEDLRPLR